MKERKTRRHCHPQPTLDEEPSTTHNTVGDHFKKGETLVPFSFFFICSSLFFANSFLVPLWTTPLKYASNNAVRVFILTTAAPKHRDNVENDSTQQETRADRFVGEVIVWVNCVEHHLSGGHDEHHC